MRAYMKKLMGGGEKVVQLDDNFSLSGDYGADADAVASTIGLVAELMGEYIERFAEADARYRHWRGEKTQELAAKDAKLAQWKVDRFIEADPDFMRHKTILAKLEGEVESLKRYFESLRLKADLLRTISSRDAAVRYGERGMTAAEDTESKPLVSGDRASDTDPHRDGAVSPSDGAKGADRFRRAMKALGTHSED